MLSAEKYEYRENMLVATGQGTVTFTSSVNAAPRRPNPSYDGGQVRPPLLPLPTPPQPPAFKPQPQTYQPTPQASYYPPPQPYQPTPQPSYYPPPQPYYPPPPQPYYQPQRPPQQPQPPQQRPPQNRGRPDGCRRKGGRGNRDRVATPWQEGESLVKSAKRKDILLLIAGGVMVMTMMMMTLGLVIKVPMG